ncbi:MAG: gliding motility-associated C-terminal domain-containing protein, partial [Bacteroidetes bacterium]|nr:gliding motility-associated C-terminal domain-containing protein [Bacteroidota bacterium]
RGYHATPGSSTLTPYSVDTWPELTAAFCGSIENNSFFKFTASQSNVQLRVFGSCTSGTGIQMMAFSLNTPLLVNGAGPITTYGCFSPLNIASSPPQGVPLTFTGMVPGSTYYVMIDGFAGAICDYKIAADYGVQVSTNVAASATKICLGNSTTLTASGGDGNYTWDANPDLSSTSGSVVTALPSAIGVFSYVVSSPSTDPNCPSTKDTAFIDVQTVPSPNAGIDDSVCFGQVLTLNGAVSNSSNSKLWQFLPPTGTNPVVTFSPNFSNLNANVTVSLPGLYRFILRETSQLCGQFRDTMNMLVINPIQTLTPTAPTCFGRSDGNIVVSSTYAEEYSYDNGVTWSNSNTSPDLAAGTYDVCTRNYLGCTTCSQVIIPDGVVMSMSVSNDTTVCENGTGAISALATGGTSFSYHWDHTADVAANQNVLPTSTSYYGVYSENQDGCLSLKDSVLVTVRPSLIGTISMNDTICPGEGSTITVSTANGLGTPYNYSWSDGTTNSGNGNVHEVKPDSTETFTVTITDNCESSPLILSTEIYVSPIPVPTFTVDAQRKCEPAIFDLEITTDPNTYSTSFWMLNDGQIFTNNSQPSTNAMFAGAYDVQLILTNKYGCVDSVTYYDYLEPQPIPTARFLFNPGQPSMFNTLVRFENVSMDATQYDWTFDQGSPPTSTEESPQTFFPDGFSGNYPVQLKVTSDFGCVDSITQIIEVLPEVLLFAPNTFTPDGDQFNQQWKFVLEGVDEFTFVLEIRNRWGQLIFQSSDINEGWDGTVNGDVVQQECTLGTFKQKIFYLAKNTSLMGL